MEFSKSELNKFRELGKVYLQAKALILYAEEIDPNSHSNLQIIKELRDAFDHLMQVFLDKENKLQGKSKNNEDYGKGNIEKAIAHVYRAAFDALDGAVLSLKVLITEVLQKYPVEVILQVKPDYWEAKKTLIKISERVGTYRGQKDISANINSVFESYVGDLESLRKIYDDLLGCGPAFEECLKHQKSQGLKKYRDELIVGIILSVLSFLLGFYFNS